MAFYRQTVTGTLHIVPRNGKIGFESAHFSPAGRYRAGGPGEEKP